MTSPEELILTSIQQYSGWAAVFAGFAVMAIRELFKSREYTREQKRRDNELRILLEARSTEVENKLLALYGEQITEYKARLIEDAKLITDLQAQVDELKKANVGLQSELTKVLTELEKLRTLNEMQMKNTEEVVKQLAVTEEQLTRAREMTEQLLQIKGDLELEKQRIYDDYALTNKALEKCRDERDAARFRIAQLEAQSAVQTDSK